MKKSYWTHLIIVKVAFILFSCQPANQQNSISTTLKTGTWRAVIQSPGGELPFGLDITKQTDTTFSVVVLNGGERLNRDEATLQNDSLHIPMRLFEAEIVAKAEDSILTGYYFRQAANRIIRMEFRATQGDTRRFADVSASANINLSGKWDVTFYDKSDSSKAVGVFTQKENELTGTFLTSTGDYRYLVGNVSGKELKLSTFDGSHVYLFKSVSDSTGQKLSGEFWSGDRGYKKWIATRNEKAALPDANTYTLLKKGYDALSFTFPDLTGKNVSLNDDKYRGKVVIVQIMGSWCPNCMDETSYLAPWYKKNKDRGVEIIGLAFEKSKDLAVSGPKLERMKKRFGIEYDVLLAGINDSTASQSLPMLEKIKGYPTTIFIDKKGKVRRIHTGFSGPGTGIYYDEFVEEFNLFVDKLVASPGPSGGGE